jgi:hypothetical protein
MDSDTARQLLRELKTIRVCAVIATIVFVVAFLVDLLGIRF